MKGLFPLEKFRTVKTPFYYYDTALLRKTLEAIKAELKKNDNYHLHYAVKANANPKVLRLISAAGFGADCVSGGEIKAALEAGFPASKIVFAGVGKSDWEINLALDADIFCFNVESIPELEIIDQLAGEKGKTARVSFRINPDVGAHTHANITTGLAENKFGIAMADMEKVIEIAATLEHVKFTGLHFHVGSQITDVENVFSLVCERVNSIVEWFEGQGFPVESINLGGGLGVDYEDPDGRPVADFETWFGTVAGKIRRRNGQTLHLEPGRSIVAQCGTLVSRVLYVKVGETKNFLILDAGMNDLVRPALYGAYHKIENLSSRLRPNLPQSQIYDVVGPVCESSDVWGAGRFLPLSVRGDLMAIRSAGAYGQSMSSRYNLRDLAPAVYSDDMHGARLRTEYFQE